MKYLFMEPHPDDTVLSAFFFAKELKEQGHEIYVASACNKSVKDKWRDSKKFCDTMGYIYVPTNFADQPFFAQHRLADADIKAADNAFKYTVEQYKKNWPKVISDVDTVVKDTIELVKPDVVVTTLGILHLMHIATRIAVEKYAKDIIYYADSPYQWRAYGRPFLACNDIPILKKYRPEPEEIEKKMTIFEKCYPSEKYMITVDRYLYYRHHEITYRRV